MDSELSSRLETVASRLENKGPCVREVDENEDYYNSRALASSPAEAECGDSPGDRAEEMAIEDACELNWDEDANLTTPCDPGLGMPLPMPATPSYDLPVPTRPESPNFNQDLEQLFNTEQNNDVLGSSAPGVCGLCNLGNTCFMNSGLQCLLNTPAMVHFFVDYAKDAATSDTLATHFSNLFKKVWSGKYSKVKPIEFHQSLASSHSQFKDYRQHDCQEFLALLLGSLHELLNTASSKSHVSDLSVDPMTPHSVCEEETNARTAVTDAIEPDSTSQMALSMSGLRCEVSSSSSRSSESSIGASHIRLRPLPEEIHPFKAVPVAASVLWEAMDSISETCDTGPAVEETQDSPPNPDDSSSNLIAQSALKRDAKMVNLITTLNNSQPCFRMYPDILKEAKTSNVNVLVTESGANNEIVFDSDKFPKHENTRRRDTFEHPNLTEFHNFEGKTVSVKRIKETNKLQDMTETTREYMDSSTEFCNGNKRFKLEENLEKEKNLRMEFERKLRDDEKLVDSSTGEYSGAAALRRATAAAIVDDDLEADKQWEKHLGHNQSIIVDSFQGQFKSTVVCSECRHVSSTYEPFMYLSVPLPHALEQQLCVTYVPANASPPTQFLLTLNKHDRVGRIKQQLRTLLKANVSLSLELAEVLQHHIARILNENNQLRYIGASDPHRSIYAFEMTEDVVCTGLGDIADAACDTFGSEPLDLTPDQMLFRDTVQLNNLDNIGRKSDGDCKIANLTNNLKSNGSAPAADDWKTCTICLEEVEKGLKNHKGCSCFLCDNCIEGSVRHYNDGEEDNDMMKCPVCSAVVSPAIDFVAAEEGNEVRTSVRMLKVPVLFRQDCQTDENGEKSERLFGHPHLIKVASRLSGADLYRVVGKLVPYHSNYSIVLVDGQGYHCSRCLYNARCKGCLVQPDIDITLQTGDNLAVRFTLPVVEIPAINHHSLQGLRKQEQLTLYDCLDAFCESETLDEHNPWYCPTCQRNQCATKTLSVWRYPDLLIVYLKRFVFHEYTSVKLDNKVSFPLTDLTLVPSSCLQSGVSRRYNLYACVNHLGGASAGHYTAYARNPLSGEWNLFNDDTVTAQRPQEDDYGHAYVLFYQKQDMQANTGMVNSFLDGGNIRANIDQLILDLNSRSTETDSWQKDVYLI